MFSKASRDDAWLVAERLVSNIVRHKYGLHKTICLDKYKKSYTVKKGWLFPYFDENGRVTVKIDDDIIALTKDEIHASIIRSNALNHIIRNTVSKPQYVLISDSFEGVNRIFDYMYYLMMGDLSWANTEEVITNKMNHDEDGFCKNTKFTKVLKSKFQVPILQDNYFSVDTTEEGYLLERVYKSIYGNVPDSAIQVSRLRDLVYDFIVVVYSQLVSIFKNKGDKSVTLSINPIDILMSSMNTTGWRSCHNLYDGEISTGALSYVADGVTAIAYGYSDYSTSEMIELTNKDDIEVCIDKEFPKKGWRAMVYFDASNLEATLSKEYIHTSAVYTKAVIPLLAQVLSSYSGLPQKYTVENTGYALEQHDHWLFGDDDTVLKLRLEGGNKEYRMFCPGSPTIWCVSCGEKRTFEDWHDDRPQEVKNILCEYCRCE